MGWPDRYREQAAVWRAMGGEKEADCYEQLAREWEERAEGRELESQSQESDPSG